MYSLVYNLSGPKIMCTYLCVTNSKVYSTNIIFHLLLENLIVSMVYFLFMRLNYFSGEPNN